MARTGLAGLAVWTMAAADPRPFLIELQLAGRHEQALTEVRMILTEDPEQARRWGLEYLEGHLLERLDRDSQSPAPFAAAMISAPILAAHARYRLALNRYRAGQPEATAGLLATVVANDPPPALLHTALRWLIMAVQEGGDCRLLEGWRDWRLDAAQTRQLQSILLDCPGVDDEPDEALAVMRTLLAGDQTDEAALRAALGLAELAPGAIDPTTGLRMGLAFFHHREFQRAIPYLVSSLDDPDGITREQRQIDRADVLYALARSHYWLGQYRSAAQTFTQAATEETESEKIARALFQKSRALALLGDWSSAVASFEQASKEAPTESWAGAALLSAMRLEWRQGREEEALRLFEQLRRRRRWRSSLERAALFLAVSDLVRERSDRAAAWLDIARQARRRDGPEIWYWRGRLAELDDEPEAAIRDYVDLLSAETLHPLSIAARRRLDRPALRQVAQERARELAGSNREISLVEAWLLLDREDPFRREVAEKLEARWRRNSRLRPYLEMRSSDPESWHIWRQSPRQPEDVLLTLGVAETMSPTIRRCFPLNDSREALSGSRLLSSNGLHRRSLYFAEVIGQRVPASLPSPFLPASFRQLLYPRPYAYSVEQQARRFGVDPSLLLAIIREESRFDPLAVSAASARGLTQFVLSTARRINQKLDGPELDPADLHRPEVAITLGAAYLAELDRLFEGRVGPVVAAYNAGEDLARLWQAYCFSPEPEEFFSKVGFRQTRTYLEKVLNSRASYAEIYPSDAPP